MRRRKLTKQQIRKFRTLIWGHFRKHGRDLPWRNTKNPYHILVSEIMLQQTQVERVKRFYPKFLEVFPDWHTLAKAPLKKILACWQGMGYNRRAKYLRELAHIVVKRHHNKLPQDPVELSRLPGIGRATAGAIVAYAFGKPTVFIETNIRRVFIFHFFKGNSAVHDRDIFPLIEQTLDWKKPREWYWALMDYGAALGKNSSNPNRKSAHYVRQSPFKRSRRQLRGAILRALLRSPLTRRQLGECLGKENLSLNTALFQLIAEGLIKKRGNTYLVGWTPL